MSSHCPVDCRGRNRVPWDDCKFERTILRSKSATSHPKKRNELCGVIRIHERYDTAVSFSKRCRVTSMLRVGSLLSVFVIFVTVSASGLQSGLEKRYQEELTQGESVLWFDPGDVAALDLAYGIGGSEGQPQPPFRFVN